MDSLQEILGKRDFTPPDEMAAVKEYITRRYKSTSTVRVERDVLIVRVPSSALAATLQLEQNRMIEVCRITRRLIIRYGR
jgi:ribulose 1,5-bisphosphate synthetase/thiazole synthase